MSRVIDGPSARHLGRAPRPGHLLTASLLTLVVSGSIFGFLVLRVVGSDGPIGADSRLLRDVVGHREDWLTPVARVVTNLGAGPLLYAVVITLGVALWWRTREWMLPVCAVALLWAGQAVRVAINHAIGRPRPPRDLWLVEPGSFAFPSGHTEMATVGYALAAVLLVRLLSGGRRMVGAVSTVAAVLAIMIGLSRVYLGVHWPSDVAGGWSFGVAWLALAATVACLWQRRSAGPDPGPDPDPDPGSGSGSESDPATGDADGSAPRETPD